MQPLKGKTVLDLSRLLPGGFCTHILAELGAKVVKVEEPVRGDYLRSLEVPAIGMDGVFSAINRGKESIGLNLKSKQGREILKKLVSDCDVFFESFRPGTIQRLGFSFGSVRRINPTIVYCSMSAFGRSSSLSSAPAHDLNYQALIGALTLAGTKPVTPMVQWADLCAGMYAAIGIAAALASKKRKAVLIDIPIVQSLMSLMVVPVSYHLATDQTPRRGRGVLFGGSPYYNLYTTADSKFVALGALERRFRANLLGELGQGEQEKASRAIGKGRGPPGRRLVKVFRSKTRDEWAKLLMKRDICVTPVLDLAEAMKSNWCRGIFQAGTIHTPFYQGSCDTKVGRSPELGQHTTGILRRLGYPREEIEELRNEGIIS